MFTHIRAPVSPVWLGKIKCSLDGSPFLSLSYISPIAARKISMLHPMQDLLHWAHKLARNGLVELGCVYNFEYMEKLLELLRATRLKNGISQDYLAVKLGVSSSSVSRWESKGNFPVSISSLSMQSFWGLLFKRFLHSVQMLQLKSPSQWVRLRSLPMIKQLSNALLHNYSRRGMVTLNLSQHI